MSRRLLGETLARSACLLGCLVAGCMAGAEEQVADVEAPADRGDAIIVRVIADAATAERVPRDLLLALGWAETRLEPRTLGLPPGAHEADEPREATGTEASVCGVFGLDEGSAREQAAALVGAAADELCDSPDLEARAAAARLRVLAGGDDAPRLTDLGAWLGALDRWHPTLAAGGFPYGSYIASVLAYGIDANDAVGASISMPAIEVTASGSVAGARLYSRPDTPLADWRGPACDYTPASRSRGDVRFVIIHTCEGGFAGCIGTLTSCSGYDVSAHYVTSYTGFTVQMVEENDIAWHVGCINSNSIGIEHEGFAGSHTHPDAQYCKTARIVKGICDRWGIPCDRSHVIGHVEANARYCGGSHWDPGPYWDWRKFMRYVNGECICPGSAEVCDGRDNDCDGSRDEDSVCEREEIIEHAGVHDARSSDFDGDGLADVCARTSVGLRCHTSRGTSFGPAIAGPDLAPPAWNDPSNYATIRTGDVNGDGLADVCARTNSRFVCWPSTGAAFGPQIAGPEMTDADGWSGIRHYATIRLADIDGDGKDDVCYRASAGFRCRLSTGTGFGDPGAVIPELSDASGGDGLTTIGTIRMGDVDGDGRSDVCARKPGGMWCWLSDGSGFPTKIEGPAMSDANGWDRLVKWATIRVADADGDGKDDVCGRGASGFACWLSTGSGFGAAIAGPMTDAFWSERDNYQSLRMGDIDGDGGADLCARTDTGIRCWRFDGGAWSSPFSGPDLTASNWEQAPYYRSLRLGDIDGDHRADVCVRRAAGVACWASTGTGFGPQIDGPAWESPRVWESPAFYSTIRISSVRSAEPPDTDGGTIAPRTDGGSPQDEDASAPEPRPEPAGCECRASGAGAPSALGWIALLAGTVVVLARRKRRRPR